MPHVSFFLLAVLALWSGWRVFRVDSMIRATYALMVSFLAVGGIGLLLAAPYIGVAIVFMIAVEMVVMGLFMVMFMMNPAGLNPMQMVHQHRLSIAAGVIVFVMLFIAVVSTDLPTNEVASAQPVIRALGLELLGDSMLIFETAGITLLATMLGAVILSSRSGRYGASDSGSIPPGLVPDGSPAGRIPREQGGHGGHQGHEGHEGSDEHRAPAEHSKNEGPN